VATTLSSKSFFVPKDGLIPWEQIHDWIWNTKQYGKDFRISVTIDYPGEKRQKKATAKAELEAYVANALLEGKSVWKGPGYCFDFFKKLYAWNGESIYITANEALFLFRWLVLDDEVYSTQWFYLRNMRRRLGKDFLADVQVATQGAKFD
jgi:hypothetical protein